MAGFAMLKLAIEIEDAEASLANSAGLAQAEMAQIANALSKLEIVGLEGVNGIPAEKAVANDIDTPDQSVDGETFKISRAVMWGDPANLVLLKYRFEGTATAEGESREFYIEVENSDFRNPAGCGAMYEPYRRTMRMGGLLNEEQTAEMEKARAQLAEFEQQMASMPAQQRQMMERMMGQQMAMVRSLASSGAMEMVEQTEEIICNPDMASLYSLGGGPGTSLDALVGSSSGGSFASLSEKELLRQIQEDLAALGYMPGNTDGVLDTLTQIAISQFEAEQGLAVTGAPSVALAQLLADLTA
jgi:hypothetical protein